MVFTTETSPSSDDARAWREILDDWFTTAGESLVTLALILLAALVFWVVGRLVIRGIVRGISDGVDWTETQARGVLHKVKLSQVEEQSIEDQLLDERRVSRAHTIGQVLRAVLNVAVISVVILMILSELGVSVAPILASAGILGVALGFGAQSLVKDLLAGFFMLVEDQFGVGDVIDVGEASGLVEEVGLRATRLRSLDGTVWFVPNGEIRRVGNMSQLYSRAMVEVRFAYDTDIDAAREAMIDAALMTRDNEDLAAAIIGEPEVAGVESIDYQSVMLRLLMQVKPLTQWAVMREIRSNMRNLFLERGIALAAPEGSLIQSGSDLEPKKPAVKKPAVKKPTVTLPTKPSKRAPKSS